MRRGAKAAAVVEPWLPKPLLRGSGAGGGPCACRVPSRETQRFAVVCLKRSALVAQAWRRLQPCLTCCTIHLHTHLHTTHHMPHTTPHARTHHTTHATTTCPSCTTRATRARTASRATASLVWTGARARRATSTRPATLPLGRASLRGTPSTTGPPDSPHRRNDSPLRVHCRLCSCEQRARCTRVYHTGHAGMPACRHSGIPPNLECRHSAAEGPVFPAWYTPARYSSRSGVLHQSHAGLWTSTWSCTKSKLDWVMFGSGSIASSFCLAWSNKRAMSHQSQRVSVEDSHRTCRGRGTAMMMVRCHFFL